MKHRRRQRAVDPAGRKDVREMAHLAGATGGDQWHTAALTHRGELFEIVAGTHTVVTHAIQHDLTGSSFLNFIHPLHRQNGGLAGLFRVARVGENIPVPVADSAVDTDDHALGAKPFREFIDKRGILERRRIH